MFHGDVCSSNGRGIIRGAWSLVVLDLRTRRLRPFQGVIADVSVLNTGTDIYLLVFSTQHIPGQDLPRKLDIRTWQILTRF